MRPLAKPLLVVLALGVAGLACRYLQPGVAPAVGTPSAPSVPPPSRDSSAPLAAAARSPAPAAPDTDRAETAERISAAAASCDADALPELARHLSDPDPVIRALALDGILQLGDSAGSETLRAAARGARDPREAASLLEAADYLALPPAPPASGTYQTFSSHWERHSASAQGRASPAF